MMTKIAKEYNVGNSTLTEEQIENSRISDHNGESVCLPKRTNIMRLAKDGQLDEAL